MMMKGRPGPVGIMKCISCLKNYDARAAVTCKECYKEANETKEELKREIDDLKSKVAFLKFSSRSFHPLPFSDVVMLASDNPSTAVPIPAHKAVLASRSPVFKAMLENGMEESLSSTIKIGDVSYDALCAFVSYLYTAEACLDEEMACHLLILAEKYQVQHLKEYCERFLVSKLNWENSIASYTFAHQHNAKHVVDAALMWITDNMDKLTTRKEYMELVQKDPRLVVEVYEAYLSRQNSQKGSAGRGGPAAKPLSARVADRVADDSSVSDEFGPYCGFPECGRLFSSGIEGGPRALHCLPHPRS